VRKRRLRLGSADRAPTLPHHDDDSKFPHQGLHWIAKTNEQFPNGVLATCSRKWSSMTVPFIRKSTQRNSSWPGDSAYTKAEYICADCRSPFCSSLAVARRTIHCGNYDAKFGSSFGGIVSVISPCLAGGPTWRRSRTPWDGRCPLCAQSFEYPLRTVMLLGLWIERLVPEGDDFGHSVCGEQVAASIPERADLHHRPNK
jgi:hypothetical protein